MLPLVGHVLVHQVAVVLNHVLKKEENERTVDLKQYRNKFVIMGTGL